jgi:hypothetical protein
VIRIPVVVSDDEVVVVVTVDIVLVLAAIDVVVPYAASDGVAAILSIDRALGAALPAAGAPDIGIVAATTLNQILVLGANGIVVPSTGVDVILARLGVDHVSIVVADALVGTVGHRAVVVRDDGKDAKEQRDTQDG